MRTRTTTTLATIEPGSWDALADGALYSSYTWLSLLESDADAEVGYAIVEDGGQLLAATPFAHVHRERNPLMDWPALLRARGLDPGDGQRLIAAPRRGYQAHVLTAPGVDQRTKVKAAALLLAHLDREAHARGLAGVLVLYADSVTARLVQAARAGATVAHLAHDAWIEPVGARFSDYLRSLGSHRRARVRREMAVFNDAGYRCEHVTLEAAAGEAGSLLAQTQARHGHPADREALARSLAAQGRAMGDGAEVLVLRRGARAVGFVSFYCWGDTLFLRAAGFDYERLAGAAEYFNLVYYLPVAIAYERGLRRLHAGIEATEAKALRGASIRPLWLVDFGSAIDSRQAAHHNAAVLDELLSGSTAVARAVDAAAWLPWASPAEDDMCRADGRA